jgi:ATP-dependent helicase/nuclease subunit A
LSQADNTLLQAATLAQREAFAPTQSVWVAANAGTGKTTVLTRRLLALLLADNALQPREILALTFTRAAAAEMALRLPKLVQEFAALTEDALQQKIATELGVPAPPNAVAHVQEIAAALAQQPPLITTLHGFAQHLLAALPAAAGLPEGFGLLDEAGQNRLLQEVQQQVIETLDDTLAPYLATLLNELGEHGWAELTELTLRNWWQLEARLNGQGVAGIATIIARLEAALALPPDAEIYAPHQPTALQREMLATRGFSFADEAAWLGFLLTKTLTPKKNILKKDLAKGLSEDLLQGLSEAANYAAAMQAAKKSLRGLRLTEALLTYTAYVQANYTQAKRERGVLDFADLLRHLQTTLQASHANETAAWLWHRLDRRFKHLVVDEAQDNNAAQGAVIQWLTKQLLAGEVGSTSRTVLAVGDVKQSIYRFQGAQPQEFYDLRELMRTMAPQQAFTQIELTTTFRNGRTILDLVNAVFAGPELSSIVQGEAAPWPTHRTVFGGRPSRVEIWPLAQEAGTRNQEPGEDETGEEPSERWPLAHERVAGQMPSAKVQCLQQVVSWVQAQYAAGVVLPSTATATSPARPLEYRDVLIVVQRNSTAQLVAGLLRRAGVPVAAPRGESPLAVQDLAALLRVVFNPADNLALAQVLKGLEAWPDARLLAFANQAGQGPWLGALPAQSGVQAFLSSLPQPCPPVALIQAAVAWWGLDLAQFVPLLAWAESAQQAPAPALGPLGTLVQRLEEEALPVVPGPGVRVLTLHTAKGLEAPLVVLPEAGMPLAEIAQDRLLWGEDIVLFKQGEGLSALEDGLIASLKAARLADDLRALYVALTRAADWLVVTGWQKSKKPAESSEEA